MRKLVVVAGLLLAAALIPGAPAQVPGAPAQAAVGCQCVKLGTPSACVPTVHECNTKIGGICMAPCAYTPGPPKKMVKRHAVKHAVAKKTTVKKKPQKKM